MNFKGYMRLYLNADSMEEMLAKSQFYGDWLTKRKKILSKSRVYHVNLYTAVIDRMWDKRVGKWEQVDTYPTVYRYMGYKHGQQLHIKYVTKGKVTTEGLWQSMKDAVGILLDTGKDEYFEELYTMLKDLMDNESTAYFKALGVVSQLPDTIEVDRNQTYATIRS